MLLYQVILESERLLDWIAEYFNIVWFFSDTLYVS